MRLLSGILLLCLTTVNSQTSLPITLPFTLPFTLPVTLPFTLPPLTLSPTTTQAPTQQQTQAPTQETQAPTQVTQQSNNNGNYNNENYVCPNSGGYNSFGIPPAGGYSCQTSSQCSGSAHCTCGNACYDPSQYCCYEGHLGQAIGRFINKLYNVMSYRLH